MTAPRTVRRIEDARARVVQAAWELLRERSWGEITVAEICARADVAPRTFHRYFVDKIELLFSDAPRHEETLARSLATHDCDADDPRPYLEAVMADMAAEIEDYAHTEVAQRMAIINAHPELAARELLKGARLQAIATEGLAARLPADQSIRCRMLGAIAMEAAWVGIQEWAERGGDLAAHMRHALDAAELQRPAGHQAPSASRRPTGSNHRR